MVERGRDVTAAVALGAAAVLLSACGAEESGPRAEEAPNEAPRAGPSDAVACVFQDVTHAAGIDFVHVTGGRGAKLLPETMGAGACLFDLEDDGDLDLFLVNSGDLMRGDASTGARSALFVGRGDGTFTDESAARGADVDVYGMGAAAADFDGDGDQDLYVTALGADAFLVNAGERFHAIQPDDVGLHDPGWVDDAGDRYPSWSTAAAWLDADVDGDLDLFVGGYCRWTPELEIFTTLDGVTKAFTTPDRYQGLAPRLYANDGDGTFTRVADPAIEGAIGKTLGVAIRDLDQDGAPEILVANDTRPNFLLRRDAGGAWREEGEAAGVAYDENGRARAGMGIDAADLDGTNGTWLAIGNFAGEPMSLHRWNGERFQPRAAFAGIARATTAPLAFGLSFRDLDLDGRLDLVVLNGHIEPDIARMRPAESHAQPGQVFLGLGDGRFREASAQVGDLATPRVGRGLAAGDVDGDGDLDLVVTQNGAPAVLLCNLTQERAPRRFLRVRLVGRGPGRDALGAVVTLTAGARTQRRAVRTGSSYLSQSETTLTFGLGDAERVDALEVRWPDGRVERIDAVEMDRTLVLREP